MDQEERTQQQPTAYDEPVSLSDEQKVALADIFREEITCTICLHTSALPMICGHCGNNVGCRDCIEKLFNHSQRSNRTTCTMCRMTWSRFSNGPNTTYTNVVLDRSLMRMAEKCTGFFRQSED